MSPARRTLKLEQLHPYKSFLLCALPQEPADHEPASQLLARILKEIRRDLQSDRIASISGPRELAAAGELSVGFLTYVQHVPVRWADDDADLVDTLHHLVLVGARDGYAAVFCSDTGLRDNLARRVGSGDGSAIGSLHVIPPGRLNAAFVKDATRTLWLSAAHRRVPSRADNKILAGLDLKYALDPLGDQSFFFTAARSALRDDTLHQPVGVSPRRSRIWLGPSQKWAEFQTAMGRLLELVHDTAASVRDPLPVLASPACEPEDVKDIEGAYDAALVPPELLEPVEDAVVMQEAERWSRASFTIVGADAAEPRKGADFQADVRLVDGEGQPHALGRMAFAFNLDKPDKPQFTVETAEPPAATPPLREWAEDLRHQLGRHPSWLKVWYDSGHTLADRTFVRLRYRDQRFDGFVWADFTGFDVTAEKPPNFPGTYTPRTMCQAASARASLFCWVLKCWPPASVGRGTPGRGWLACNDGSMEIADFIHLDLDSAPPVLSLIHVKGSHLDDAKRAVSVSDYEVVTGQAVKNLRQLDNLVLSVGLDIGLAERVQKLVWKDGAPAERAQFIQALGRLGANYERQVVIVQPRATYTAVAGTLAAPARDARAYQRLIQLETLLLGARANCQALGARLVVVGDGR